MYMQVALIQDRFEVYDKQGRQVARFASRGLLDIFAAGLSAMPGAQLFDIDVNRYLVGDVGQLAGASE